MLRSVCSSVSSLFSIRSSFTCAAALTLVGMVGMSGCANFRPEDVSDNSNTGLFVVKPSTWSFIKNDVVQSANPDTGASWLADVSSDAVFFADSADVATASSLWTAMSIPNTPDALDKKELSAETIALRMAQRLHNESSDAVRPDKCTLSYAHNNSSSSHCIQFTDASTGVKVMTAVLAPTKDKKGIVLYGVVKTGDAAKEKQVITDISEMMKNIEMKR